MKKQRVTAKMFIVKMVVIRPIFSVYIFITSNYLKKLLFCLKKRACVVNSR